MLYLIHVTNIFHFLKLNFLLLFNFHKNPQSSEYIFRLFPNNNTNVHCSSASNTKMTHQCWCLRIWAWSPKVEAQILPQSWQGTAVLEFGTLFFLADLLSSRLCSRLLSKCFVPLCIAALQAGRSWAKACHSSTGMLQALRVDFSTSLYRFLCLPLCRLPVESSAWNSCFGSLLSSMQVTCPDQRSCAWFNMASMPVSSAQRRISWFGTWSFQMTRRTLRRQHRWNWSSFLVCCL